MRIYTLSKWQHDHNFTRIDPSNERKTLRAPLLTASMMGLEIAAGMVFGSLALLAMTAAFITRIRFNGIAPLPKEGNSIIRNARNLPRIVVG